MLIAGYIMIFVNIHLHLILQILFGKMVKDGKMVKQKQERLMIN